MRRYRCKTCGRTFNPAKIPYWRDKVEEFVWKLVQIVVKDRVAVNSLAKMWGVPETTLRTLVTAVKDFLASNLEIAKQLQERLVFPDTVKHSDLRIVFYDEGFIKLLGGNGFIMFTLRQDGTPIDVAIESQRDAETIYGYFMQAMTQLGGIDVIVSIQQLGPLQYHENSLLERKNVLKKSLPKEPVSLHQLKGLVHQVKSIKGRQDFLK
ncbi:MAG: hypothetical protein ACTSPG_01455, partial [Candidatus Hodarchaeales archaeon]